MCRPPPPQRPPLLRRRNPRSRPLPQRRGRLHRGTQIRPSVAFRLHFVTDDLRGWVRRSAEYIAQIAEGSGNRLTFESILDALASGHYRLAVALSGDDVRAAMVWQPIHWKTGLKEFEVIGLTGKGMRDWLHLDDELKAKAKEMGFDVIRPYARPGWVRVMKSRGYEMTHAILECKL